MLVDIKSLSLEELENFILSLGEKKFRGKQIFQWLHEKKVTSFEQMSNLSKDLQKKLAQSASLTTLTQVECRCSNLDDTRKYLFQLEDGHVIESVRMKYQHGNSVCISSQVGCRMGCRFCASTLDGLERNLTAAEMLEQVYAIERDLQERVSHVVVMGTGEPLDNYDNLVKFLQLISHPQGNQMSQRNITVSTCGIVPKMKQLAKEQLQITLALSLHAPNQEKRKELMPVANRFDIKEVIAACKEYYQATKRRITFEYSLVQGENDSKQDAKELAALIKGMNCHVNLIPVNPIKERSYQEPKKEAVYGFQKELQSLGINATIRRELGRDIQGSCGQLRRSYVAR